MFFFIKVITAVFLVILASNSTANEYSAHTHGHAVLTIVIEQNNVDLNLIVPAESLLGFEHKATTTDEISKVVEMKKYLSQHNNVILFDSSECQTKSVDINTGDILSYDHQEHEPSHVHSHAEITVNYQFHCAKTSDISSATVKLFNLYTALESIDVMWVTSSQQGSIELDIKNTGISFR